MDYASQFPKFERLKNYIQFVNQEKNNEIFEAMEKAAGGRAGIARRGTLLTKIANAKKMNPIE